MIKTRNQIIVSTSRIFTSKNIIKVLKTIIYPILLVWFGYYLGTIDTKKNEESQRIIWTDKFNQLNIICQNNLQEDLIIEYEKVLSEMVIKTEQDKITYGIVKLQLGYLYMSSTSSSGDYNLAVYNLLEADKMINSSNPAYKSRIYSMLGTCYYQLGITNKDTNDFNKGRDYFARALEYQDEIDINLASEIYLKYMQAKTNSELAFLYKDYYSYANEAIIELDQFYSFAKLGIDDKIIAKSHSIKGNIYMDLFTFSGNVQFLDSSILYFEKALNYLNLNLQSSLYNSILMKQSELYIHYSNVYQDEDYLKKSLLNLSTIIERTDSVKQPRLYNLSKLKRINVKVSMYKDENVNETNQHLRDISRLRKYFVSIKDEKNMAGCYFLEFLIYVHRYVILNDESSFQQAFEIYNKANQPLKLLNDKIQYAFFKYHASTLFAKKFNLSQNDMYRENAIKCYEEAKQYVDFPWPYHIPNYSISFEFEIDSNMIMENNDTSFQTIFEVNF